jgi:hypothetical protein
MTGKQILRLSVFFILALTLAGCKSWRDNIADYTEESYDSTLAFFDSVAIDFKMKDKDKYKRRPYEDEFLMTNKFIQLGYSPRIERLTTIERIECENMLHILSPEEEKKLVENEKKSERGGVCLLYDLQNSTQIPVKSDNPNYHELHLKTPDSAAQALIATLKMKPEQSEVIFSVKPVGDDSVAGNSLSAHFEFNKPLSIIFEDRTGKMKNSRIINVRPAIYYFAPPREGPSDTIKVHGSWIVILYRYDMMIFCRPKTKKVLPYASYQFKTTGKKLIFDSIIPPMGNESQKIFTECWQILFRTALYNPGTLADYLMQSHIENLYKP